MSSNLDAGKLGVVTKSFKIVLDCFKTLLQPSTIQFLFACNTNVFFVVLLWININLCQILEVLMNGTIYEHNGAYKISSWCKLSLSIGS